MSSTPPKIAKQIVRPSPDEDLDLEVNLERQRNQLQQNLNIRERSIPIQRVIPLPNPDPRLSLENAVTLVNHGLSLFNKSPEDVRILVKVLHYHPTPIRIAIAYIKNELHGSENPIKGYLKIFKSRVFFANQRLTELENATLKTLNLSLCVIRDGKTVPGILAYQFIFVAAFYEPDVKIDSKCFTEVLKEFPDESTLNSTISLLKKYSIISGPVGTIYMCEVVQRALQRAIPLCNIPGFLKTSLFVVREHMHSSAKCEELTKSLIPHGISAWNCALKHEEVILSCSFTPSLICQKLERFDMIKEMFELSRESSPCLERVLGPRHEHTISIKYYEARACSFLKKFTESMELLNGIRELSFEELGRDHSMPSAILQKISENFGALQKYQEQLEVLREIEEIQLEKDGHETASVLLTQFNISVTLALLGRRREAMNLARSIYETRKRDLGEEDFWTEKVKDWINTLLTRFV